MTQPLDTGTQFAGLTPAERAIAAVHPHMSTCDAPTVEDCGECRVRLAVIRRDLAAVTPVIRQQEQRDTLRDAAKSIREKAHRAGFSHLVTEGVLWAAAELSIAAQQSEIRDQPAAVARSHAQPEERTEEECPHLAAVLAGRLPGPHVDTACGWCADIRRRSHAQHPEEGA